MAIAEINDTANHSTGSIMAQICRSGWINGYEIYTFSPLLSKSGNSIPGHYYIGNAISRAVNRFMNDITGFDNFLHLIPTFQTLRTFDKLNIDLIHIHNIRGFCISLPLLFRYIRRKKIPVVWTLHGTWTYTGECGVHSLYNCDKWITGCHDCEQLRRMKKKYLYDPSAIMWRKKKKWTEGVDITVAAPSEWVADCARKSFLGCHDIRVIHNGINPYIFYPRENPDFKSRYGIEGKVMLLGVADEWGQAKGLDVMLELANRLDSDRYKVVLVGTNDHVDKLLPDSIISVHRTADRNELAEIYSAADLFIMTTRAEIFGLVSLEAMACGTPVITFNTDACPEIVDETCGAVVEKDDIPALIEAIEKETREHNFTPENCVKRASQFTQAKMTEGYLELYSEILNRQTAMK